MRIAAIDIGSNAARLLINEVLISPKGKPEFIKLNLLRIPLRLGMDVFKFGEIKSERKEMLIRTMKIFSEMMKIYNVDEYRACATSAMRDAKNGSSIRKEISEISNITIEIISGDEEASLIFENQIAESLDHNFGYLYIDVGGGSTELMYFENGKIQYKKSFNIGTIRLLNNLVEEEQWKEMREEIKNKILHKKHIIAIGSGGNINKLSSINKTKDGKFISYSSLKNYYKEFSELSLEERMRKFNLREDRADVIVPALEIFTKIMNWGKVTKILVPKISVADGLIHHLYNQINNRNS